MVAVFQRLSYKELVNAAIRKSRGVLEQAPLLTELAQQLGWVRGKKAALRSAISQEEPDRYDKTFEPHRLGAVLLCAVFEAYLTVFRRKTAPLMRLASGGSGISAPGELPHDLSDLLAHSASSLAGHFLALIIRAVDYCPPVDIRLGEYLRALITADHDLVPDDPWGYREALIDAFFRRNIYPRHVPTLSEKALLWRPTRRAMAPVRELDFAHLEFEGDPASAVGSIELTRQARVLGEFATRPQHLHEFGLLSQSAAKAIGATAGLPEVQSIRTARRIGPDGQIVFDLVAEIIQPVAVHASDTFAACDTVGGATVILGPEGDIRYVISKCVSGCERMVRRREYMDSPRGQHFWQIEDGKYKPKGTLFEMLHPSDAAHED
ncbi:MAG: hypothetical protein V4631_22335 [Pseudomonadota bacterium]